MKIAPPHPHERRRLEALHATLVLDTPRERAFDDIARMASSICGMPIALVTFIDADRQWLKAAVGLDATEAPRDITFCAHAIHGEGVLEVKDSLLDERCRSRSSWSPSIAGFSDGTGRRKTCSGTRKRRRWARTWGC